MARTVEKAKLRKLVSQVTKLAEIELQKICKGLGNLLSVFALPFEDSRHTILGESCGTTEAGQANLRFRAVDRSDCQQVEWCAFQLNLVSQQPRRRDIPPQPRQLNRGCPTLLR